MNDDADRTPLCEQCGRPAFYDAQGHLLCLDCNYKREQIEQMQFARTVAALNFTTQEFHRMSGQSGLVPPPPQMRLPQPTIYAGSTTLNHIKVDRSTIGAINTGHVQVLDAAVTHFRDAGNSDLADKLRDLSQAVVNATDVAKGAQEEVIELLAYLTKEAAKPLQQRSKPVGKSIMSRLGELLKASQGLASLWETVRPLLENLFPS